MSIYGMVGVGVSALTARDAADAGTIAGKAGKNARDDFSTLLKQGEPGGYDYVGIPEDIRNEIGQHGGLSYPASIGNFIAGASNDLPKVDAPADGDEVGDPGGAVDVSAGTISNTMPKVASPIGEDDDTDTVDLANGEFTNALPGASAPPDGPFDA